MKSEREKKGGSSIRRQTMRGMMWDGGRLRDSERKRHIIPFLKVIRTFIKKFGKGKALTNTSHLSLSGSPPPPPQNLQHRMCVSVCVCVWLCVTVCVAAPQTACHTAPSWPCWWWAGRRQRWHPAGWPGESRPGLADDWSPPHRWPGRTEMLSEEGEKEGGRRGELRKGKKVRLMVSAGGSSVKEGV